jgi:hypothetical protein
LVAGLALPALASCDVSPSTPLATRLCNGVAPKRVGELASAQITELSGLAASRTTPGVFWGHNDSGDVPRIFAIDRSGALRATVAVNVLTAVDWEDIAIDGKTIYIGDIGDNGAVRPSIVVYRVAEPALTATSVNATTFTLRYPDGPHNAEALMVDPLNHQLVIVTKELTGNSTVYVTSLDHPGALTAVKTLALGSGRLVTAGDIAANGAVVALRTYGQVFIWERKGSESLATTFARTPCSAPAPTEVQSEALALSPTADRYDTSSEGVGAPIWEVVGAG